MSSNSVFRQDTKRRWREQEGANGRSSDEFNRAKIPRRSHSPHFRGESRRNQHSSNLEGSNGHARHLEQDGEEGEVVADRVPSNEGDEGEYELYTEDDDARLAEERQKRRDAILRRHKEQSQVSTPVTSEISTNNSNTPLTIRAHSSSNDTPEHPFELEKDQAEPSTLDQGMSATEYDPSMDRALDHEREAKLLGGQTKAKKEDESVDGQKDSAEESEYEEVEVSDDEDIDDMFAIDDEPKPKKKVVRRRKGAPAQESAASKKSQGTAAAPSTLLDNWDDPDGYYRITLGERLGEEGRYHVFAILGQGMFSSVVRARDTKQGDQEVAIKVVRAQETMYKAGIKEMATLRKISSLDPEDKRHIIKLIGHFEHRNHLCMVFESLNMNLREVVKRFGKNVGLNLRAVRTYAHQMFLALALMRKAEIMHADLKPDNILVNENKTAIKVCDLGSASDLSDMEITPYLVSRFYRAPEIILGMPYDCALDMWSIGCTLYELYTGKILFPGRSNNHMLRLMQELKGKFTIKQIRKGRFSGLHFDDTNAFIVRDSPDMRRIQSFNPPATANDLKGRLLPTHTAKALSTSELRLTNAFIDLLNRALELDPARRLTPTQALHHPFFNV